MDDRNRILAQSYHFREAQDKPTKEAPQFDMELSSSPTETDTQQPYLRQPPAAFSFPTLTPDDSVDGVRICFSTSGGSQLPRSIF